MFNLDSIQTKSVAIHASSMVNPKLAKVVVAFTGDCDADFVQSELSKALNGQGAPVEGSFRFANIEGLGNVAVGFIRANREVRMPTSNEMRASYKVLSSNILMSNEDRSLWEVKKGKNATYLTRHSNDDLSELLDICTANVHPLSSETHAVNASVKPEKYDLVAFVNNIGDTDYGFALASNESNTKVVAYSTKSSMVIPNSAIIESREFKIDPLLAKTIKNKVEADTKDGSTADMESYYRELFAYDPQYMQEVIDIVRGMSKSIA